MQIAIGMIIINKLEQTKTCLLWHFEISGLCQMLTAAPNMKKYRLHWAKGHLLSKFLIWETSWNNILWKFWANFKLWIHNWRAWSWMSQVMKQYGPIQFNNLKYFNIDSFSTNNRILAILWIASVWRNLNSFCGTIWVRCEWWTWWIVHIRWQRSTFFCFGLRKI